MIHQAMLMAAGLGTRLKPYTDLVPKPLLPLCGVPIAQFAIDSLVVAGVNRIVANVHHHAEAARRGLEGLDCGSRGAKLEISDESAKLLGSAGGIRKALERFKGAPFFYSNADIVSEVDWTRLAERHAELRRRYGVVMTLAVFERAPEGGKYREILMDGSRERVTGLGEAAEGKAFFVGAAVLEPEPFAELPLGKSSDFVQDVLLPEIARKRVGVHLARGLWMDIGSPALWHSAHFELERLRSEGRLPEVIRARLETTRNAGTHVVPERRLVSYGGDPAEGLSDGIFFSGIWTACPGARASSRRE